VNLYTKKCIDIFASQSFFSIKGFYYLVKQYTKLKYLIFKNGGSTRESDFRDLVAMIPKPPLLKMNFI
jgi:hypothetical protein